MIYIPQNSLHAISQRPAEITEKIEPTVFRLDPAFQLAHEKASIEIEDANHRIREATALWFGLASDLTAARRKLREIGDREAIEQRQAELAATIERLRQDSSLSERETSEYQKLTDRLGDIGKRRQAIDEEARKLAPFLVETDSVEPESTYALSPSVRVNVSINPDAAGMPDEMEIRVQELIASTKSTLAIEIDTLLSAHRSALAAEQVTLTAEEKKLRDDNAALIAKNAGNDEIETHLKIKKKQDQALEKIKRQDGDIEQIAAAQAGQLQLLDGEIKRRDIADARVNAAFEKAEHRLEGMSFGLEQEHDRSELRALADRFNQQQVGPFIARGEHKNLKITEAQANPGKLLRALLDGEQKVMKGEAPGELAADVLALTRRPRFYAEMEGDRIGGFKESSMTPGKQALFALTLILNESDDAWPLLIDQPEDDLDSRSVYNVLVKYLVERKAERQIIMVSHNANLVIGADSEQLIVANRHGDDRKNPDDRLFAYRSGSLEHSEAGRSTGPVLESRGIREHACELLDGGEEAFRKRRAKYKL